MAPASTAGFVPAVIMPDAAPPNASEAIASSTLSSPAPASRLEIALAGGLRVIVEALIDVETVLLLARGLERLG